MIKKKVAILFGGCSPEYNVSLQSAYAVIEHLDSDCYEKILIGITKEGQWLRYYGDTKDIIKDTWHKDKRCIPAIISPSRDVKGVIELYPDRVEVTRIDIAFPVMHGKNGEDGTVQGLLELAGIPFVGCGSLCSALCMNKDIAHKVVNLAGVKIPESIVLKTGSNEKEIFDKVENLNYPLFVKPVKAGSSFGVTKVYSNEHLINALKVAFEFDNEAIVEENIDGFEVGCAILGNNDLIIGQVDEIELTQGFFDYKEKYTLENSQIHMPARIDYITAERIKKTAGSIYKALGCKGLARVDLFLTKDGDIVFNEVNTIPGFTSHSRYPNMLKGIGFSFEKILDNLIRLGMEE
ncbi:UNVERIFIED_CONTAM: D-alanine---D-serine ligase [Acetivibrio alkalicellulosi]